MKNNIHKIYQKSKKTFVTKWAYKEGVFETPTGEFIVRVKRYKSGYTTLCKKPTRKLAEDYLEEYLSKVKNPNL